MNSLRNNASGFKEKLAEIKLSILHPQSKSKVFILLEGKCDIKLFRSVFNSDYVDTTAWNGKKMVINALRELNKDSLFLGAGVVDADFDHLIHTDHPKNLFVTDYHDMEVQMFESDALTAVVDEFSSDQCYEILKDTIRNIIYATAIELGYARWLNEKEKQEKGNSIFRFEGLDFNQFTKAKNCKIEFCYDNFLKTLLKHSNSSISVKTVTTKLFILRNQDEDRLQICSGHDLTKLISIVFTDDKVNQKKVESILRAAYTISYFKDTNLFKSLKSWSDASNHKIFNVV